MAGGECKGEGGEAASPPPSPSKPSSAPYTRASHLISPHAIQVQSSCHGDNEDGEAHIPIPQPEHYEDGERLSSEPALPPPAHPSRCSSAFHHHRTYIPRASIHPSPYFHVPNDSGNEGLTRHGHRDPCGGAERREDDDSPIPFLPFALPTNPSDLGTNSYSSSFKSGGVTVCLPPCTGDDGERG